MANQPARHQRSEGMVALAVVALLLALLALAFAWLFLVIDCYEESYSECSNGGFGQLALALTGVALAAGTLVASVIGRLRPGIWLGATALTLATWLVVIFAVGETK